MLSRGAPLLGDPIYGKPSKHPGLPDRLMLHAWKLSFNHPITGIRHDFEAPIPPEFQPWLDLR
jgi:23S rRNA pseudouridine1911/1915/1917 synthase